MIRPYTDEEIETMWKLDMEKRKNYSEEFKQIFSWMFNFEEYKKVMKDAHLLNPYIAMKDKNE